MTDEGELATPGAAIGELAVTGGIEFYRQANAIGRAAQELALFEKRLIILALSRLDTSSEDASLEVVVPLRDFEEHGIENPYARAIAAADSVVEKKIRIRHEGGGFEVFTWVPHARYYPAKAPENELGYPYIRVTFNEALRPWITNLKSHYAVLPIRDVLQMPSMFAARLYEVLWHLSWGGQRPDIEIDLMELKFALGLVRWERGEWRDERYQDWRDFRKQLRTALGHFQSHGNLTATFVGVRVGRRIGKIRFKTRLSQAYRQRREQPGLFERTIDVEEHRLQERLRALGFTGSVAKLLERHTSSEVEAAIAITERRLRDGTLHSPGGFLRAILNDGTARQEAMARAAPRDRDGAAETGRSSEEDWIVAWEKHRREAANEIEAVEGLGKEQLIALVRESLRGQQGEKLVVKSLESSEWQGPAFDTYRTKALLERFRSRAPRTALDFEAFREANEKAPSEA